MTADRPGAIGVQATLSRPADFTVEAAGNDSLVMHGQAQHNGEHLGVKWHTLLQARAEGGKVQTVNRTLRVEEADAVTFFVAASTDYNRKKPAEPLLVL